MFAGVNDMLPALGCFWSKVEGIGRETCVPTT